MTLNLKAFTVPYSPTQAIIFLLKSVDSKTWNELSKRLKRFSVTYEMSQSNYQCSHNFLWMTYACYWKKIWLGQAFN